MTTADLAAEVLRAAADCPPAAALAASVNVATPVAVVVSSDSTESGCLGWLKQLFPNGVTVIPADTDFTADALTADASVLLFPCWGVPDPALINRWQGVLSARPEGTAHVVLDAAEQMQTADDRRMAGNLVRKWLMPTDGEPTYFRWSADARTADDRDKLQTALARPLFGLEKQRLNVTRLSLAVNLLEAAAPVVADPSPTFASGVQDDTTRRRGRALGLLRELRDGVTTAVRLAFDDLEHRFEGRLSELAPLADRPQLTTAFRTLVAEWQNGEAAGAIARRLQSGLTAVRDDLPEKSRDRFTLLSPTGELANEVFGRLTSDRPSASKTGTFSPSWRTAGAAVVTPLVAVALGVPVVGVIGGTVVATAGVLFFDRLMHRRGEVAGNRDHLRSHVLRAISAERDHAETTVHDLFARALTECKTAFDAESPPPAPPKAGDTPPPPTQFAAWRKVLAELS